VEEAGNAIEALLSGAEPNLQKAWNRARAWYKQATGHVHTPSRAELGAVTDEYQDLYTAPDISHLPVVPVVLPPFDISDDPPTEDEIVDAINRLNRGKAPGPSGIRADHLKDWVAQAFPTDENVEPDRVNLDRVLELTHEVFSTGQLPLEAPWQILVLLPKGNSGQDFRGIGLVEILWNCGLRSSTSEL
jgi:hypothetical protein